MLTYFSIWSLGTYFNNLNEITTGFYKTWDMGWCIFVSLNSDFYSTSVTAVLYAISYYIGPRLLRYQVILYLLPVQFVSRRLCNGDVFIQSLWWKFQHLLHCMLSKKTTSSVHSIENFVKLHLRFNDWVTHCGNFRDDDFKCILSYQKTNKQKKWVKIGNLLRVDFTWKISAPQLRLFTMIYNMLSCTQICDFWTMINEPWILTAWFVACASKSDRYILYKHATMYQNRTAIGSTLAALGFGSIRHITVRLQQWNSWLITYVRWHTAGNERLLTHSNCTFWNY